jgi:hypothetical protein
MGKPRRIWANTTEALYHAFRDRCRILGLRVPDTLSALVRQWAKGDLDLKPEQEYNRRNHGDDSDHG